MPQIKKNTTYRRYFSLGYLFLSQWNYQQKQFERHKTISNSSALLVDADVRSDDIIANARFPTQAELQYVQSDFLKSADNQKSLEINMFHQLQQTDLSITSLKQKFSQKYPLTVTLIRRNIMISLIRTANFIKTLKIDRKSDFVLSSLRVWIIDPSTPELQKEKTHSFNQQSTISLI